MWGQRLCLCQFLNWIDTRKYKCLPSGLAGRYGYEGGEGGGGIQMKVQEMWVYYQIMVYMQLVHMMLIILMVHRVLHIM